MLEISLSLCQQMCNNILSELGWLSVPLLFLFLLFLLWAFRMTIALFRIGFLGEGWEWSGVGVPDKIQDAQFNLNFRQTMNNS